MDDDAASILHVDLDAFYASVEVLRNPRLAGRPLAVGGGVVLSATYEARRHGVRSGMSLRDARTRCPGLAIVSGRFGDYLEYSRRVMDVFRRFTPEVEPLSIDEAFLDVSGSTRLFGNPGRIGQRIRSTIRAETGLPASVGAATTKFLAKVASRVAKPDGMVLVPAGSEIPFLHELDVDLLWGVGPVTGRRLNEWGVRTVGDLAALPVEALSAWLGRGTGRHLHALAWNRDPRPVARAPRSRSVGAQSAFGRDVADPAEHRRILLRLADRVGSRLRSKDRAGRTVTVRVRFTDFEAVTRRMRLPSPVSATSALHRASWRLTRRAVREASNGRGIGLLGISVSDLERAPALQMELPLDGGDLDDPLLRPGSPLGIAHRSLDASVDSVREVFGRNAVSRANLVGMRRQSGPTRDRLPPPEDL
jgi:DNA polymerase-4